MNKNYFVMPTKRYYSLKEDYVLSLIMMNSDSKVSHISRGKIMELTGIKVADVVTRMTNQFQKDGYIRKEYRFVNGKKYVDYIIIKPKYYVVCMNSILQYKELGVLAIKLAELRINGTNQIKYSDNDIIKHLQIGRTAYFSYKKRLIELGIITVVDDGYALSGEYFPILATIKLSDNRMNELNEILTQADKQSKLYKQASWFYENQLYIIPKANEIYDQLISGLLNK